MGRVSDKYYNVQENLLITAARRLHQWALRDGDSEQQDYATAMLEYIVDTCAQIRGYDPTHESNLNHESNNEGSDE